MEPHDIAFRSKVGVWLTFTMVVPPLVAWFCGSLTKNPGVLALVAWPALIGVEGLIVWMLLQTNYRLSRGPLWIQSAYYKIDMAITDIVAVTPSHDPVSSPALSLNRIEIEYTLHGKKASVLISPQRRDLFFRDLQNRDPGLKLIQDHLVRG